LIEAGAGLAWHWSRAHYAWYRTKIEEGNYFVAPGTGQKVRRINKKNNRADLQVSVREVKWKEVKFLRRTPMARTMQIQPAVIKF